MIQPVKEKIILGIDPGTNIMGYGILKVTGVKPARDFGWTKLKVYNICKPPVRQNRGRIVYYNQKSMASPFRVRVLAAPRVRT